MKTLLLAIAMTFIFSAQAFAQTAIAEARTQENGKIVLYDTPCSIGGRQVVIYGPFGRVRWMGCWANSKTTWANSEYVIGLQGGRFPVAKWPTKYFHVLKWAKHAKKN